MVKKQTLIDIKKMILILILKDCSKTEGRVPASSWSMNNEVRDLTCIGYYMSGSVIRDLLEHPSKIRVFQ